MNARILLWLERTFLYEFLPHAIVGAEVDVFEQLSVEHLINDSSGLLALYLDGILTRHLGSGHSSNRQKT